MKSNLVIMIIISIGVLCPTLFANNLEHKDELETHYQLSIASQNQGVFQNHILFASNDDSYSSDVSYPNYKSERKAVLLAVFPGFIIHGLGHFYAEDFLTGSVLLTLGLVTYPAFRYGFFALGLGEAEGKATIRHAVLVVAVIGFLGSWIYDFMHADVAVRKYNEKINSQIYFRSNQSGRIDMGLAFSF